MLTEREKTVVSTAVIAAVGVGVLYVLTRYRNGIMSRLKALNQRDPLRGQQVHIINTADDCRMIVTKLHKHCQEYNVLGFDCEWVSNQGKRRPVALLQLASHRGLCALIRLCTINKLPQELYDLLNDDNIIKVGVSPFDDARLLREDHRLKVESTLDLRFMAERAGLEPFGIARLANEVLGLTLDKHWKIRCSDWEAPELSERQIKYAASDAHVAVELFKKFAYKLVPHYPWTSRKVVLQQVLEEMDCYMDQTYNSRRSKGSGGSKNKKFLDPQNHQKTGKRYHTTRTKPLYHNCIMEAPDGEVLCTCDRRKAEWYVQRELADLVCQEPYTVRLRFEPAGRAVDDPGKYYQQVKENICVVCGATECFNRKNIVPRDYRRHFPVVMKEHVSHDVLLLCADCHQRSNIFDERLRQKLSTLCEAPLAGQKNGTKEIRLETMSEIRKAARALLYSAGQMPPERRQHLEEKLLQLLNSRLIDDDDEASQNEARVTELTPDLLHTYSNIDISVRNEFYCAHGERVVEYFKQRPGGLSQLERMWREQFLHTMRPKHLPALWSVDHNYKRLEIRAGEGRVNVEDLAAAGISLNSSPSTSSYSYSNSGYSQTNGTPTYSGMTMDNPPSSTRFYSNMPSQNATVASGTSGAGVATHSTQYKSIIQPRWTEATANESVSSGGSTTLFKTINSPQPPPAYTNEPRVARTTQQQQLDSELATERDFASLQLTYDSDDSNSTLSQPSSTLLYSNGTFPDEEEQNGDDIDDQDGTSRSNGRKAEEEEGDDADERSLSAIDSLVTDSSSSSTATRARDPTGVEASVARGGQATGW
ncbi:exonuclease 3'-5' domain-containing protein 2 [Anopheles ziemanni]|uniref:exonuclease 3'-5' domain-containing protein 2 n=1 Tax=Anopheles coustani TaxID=139045 RepID=UPI0026598DE5|nr:exonuclease 3'-5' domain-containing protein 2 [Anopheles coustani]XP_058169049.1 exonuclease 3'-5' domain-containing protein 2 [Anopheles ziemanni]